MKAFDNNDLKILSLLQENSRYPLKYLSEQVQLSSPAISTRIERLEKKGVIEGYMFNLNGIDGFALYDVTTSAYCFVNSTWDNNIQVLMSEDAWNKLSEEDQKIIMEIWGREGSRKMVNVLYESSLRGQEIFGEYFIQISEGEFYDAIKAEADAANQAYLDKYATQGIPVNEAYQFVLERLEAYRD